VLLRLDPELPAEIKRQLKPLRPINNGIYLPSLFLVGRPHLLQLFS
jgi:hypothetical protein